jgi:hypothetical protein
MHKAHLSRLMPEHDMNVNLPTQLSRRALQVRRPVWHVMLLPAFIAIAGLGACATGHSHKGDHVQQLVVHLTNDLAPPADVTVYAVTPEGIRLLLGDVPPNEHRVLHIPNEVSSATSFHLVADRALGRRVVSQPVTSTTSDLIIDWDLQTNSMWFPEIAQ